MVGSIGKCCDPLKMLYGLLPGHADIKLNLCQTLTPHDYTSS